jgi:hypothetical protein
VAPAQIGATIDWGDETAPSAGVLRLADPTDPAQGFILGGSHTYAEGGSYVLTITLNDDGLNKVASITVTVVHAATVGEVIELRQAIRTYQVFEDAQALEGRFTDATFDPFAEAMAAGRAALAAVPPLQDPVVAAIAAIYATGDALEVKVDTSVLERMIEDGNAIVRDPSGMVPSSIVGLAAAVAAAEAVLVLPGLTQAQVLLAEIALGEVLFKATPKGDKTGLIALISVARSLDGARFTPASWSPVDAALVIADAVVANADASVDEVTDAFTALDDALGALVLQAAKAGLKSAIDLAASILGDVSKYVPSSVDGLAQAKLAADAVYADGNATSAEVASAQSALVAKIAAVRLKPVSSSASAGVYVLPAGAAMNLAQAPQEIAAEVAAAQGLSEAALLGGAEGAAPQAAEAGAQANAKARFSSAPVPKVIGKAKVGKTLVVKARAFKPSAKLKIQWYRGSKAIAGATSVRYKVTKADKGKRLSVKVTANRAGYLQTVKASAKTAKVR